MAQRPEVATAAAPMLRGLVRWPGVSAWLAADGRPAPEARAASARSPFTTALLDALGTPDRPRNLHACLDLLNRDKALADQGFSMLGGIAPDLSLWPGPVRLKSLQGRELLLQRGHAGAVSALAFVSDGSRMITGAQDSTVKVWSVADRKVVRALSYHMVGVTGLALRPDGRLLASCDGSGWLRIWDLIEHRERSAGPPHERGVEQVSFTRDGAHLVVLDMDGKGWLVGVEDPANQVRPLTRQGTGMACAEVGGPVAFALAEMDGKVRLHGPNGKLLETLDGPGGVVTGRRMATDGRRVAAGDDAGRLLIQDHKGAKPRVFPFPNPIDAVAISPTAGLLAVASGGTVRLVSLGAADPALLDPVLALGDAANLLAWSLDGRWLAACTASGHLKLWTLADPGRPESVALEGAETTGRATTFGFSPDGRRLVSGDQDGGIRTWTLPGGNARPAVPPRRGQVAGLSVSDDGRYLLQVTQDRQAQMWDLQEGRGLSPIPGRWSAGVVSPDGSSAFLTDEESGDVVAVDRAGGLRRGLAFERPDGPRVRFARLAISRDGRWIAAGSPDGPIAGVWDARSGALVRTIRGHLDPHPITAVAFSADAKRLLTASEDGSAKLWDLGGDPAPEREAGSFALVDPATGEPVPITAAQVGPGPPYRVVVGGDRRPDPPLGRRGGAAGRARSAGSGRPGADVHDRRPVARRGGGRQVGLALVDGPRPPAASAPARPPARRAGQHPGRLAQWPGDRQRERRRHDQALEPGREVAPGHPLGRAGDDRLGRLHARRPV